MSYLWTRRSHIHLSNRFGKNYVLAHTFWYYLQSWQKTLQQRQSKLIYSFTGPSKYFYWQKTRVHKFLDILQCPFEHTSHLFLVFLFDFEQAMFDEITSFLTLQKSLEKSWTYILFQYFSSGQSWFGTFMANLWD